MSIAHGSRVRPLFATINAPSFLLSLELEYHLRLKVAEQNVLQASQQQSGTSADIGTAVDLMVYGQSKRPGGSIGMRDICIWRHETSHAANSIEKHA